MWKYAFVGIVGIGLGAAAVLIGFEALDPARTAAAESVPTPAVPTPAPSTPTPQSPVAAGFDLSTLNWDFAVVDASVVDQACPEWSLAQIAWLEPDYDPIPPSATRFVEEQERFGPTMAWRRAQPGYAERQARVDAERQAKRAERMRPKPQKNQHWFQAIYGFVLRAREQRLIPPENPNNERPARRRMEEAGRRLKENREAECGRLLGGLRRYFAFVKENHSVLAE